jgi:hypothetical protein
MPAALQISTQACPVCAATQCEMAGASAANVTAHSAIHEIRRRKFAVIDEAQACVVQVCSRADSTASGAQLFLLPVSRLIRLPPVWKGAARLNT